MVVLPAFALYERGSMKLPDLLPGRAAPAGAAPTALADAPRLVPASLNGPLTFLGASVYTDQNDLDAETWWQVTQVPITRPFSIMAHLLTAQGESLGVADGLGISPLTLQVGDIVVQRHRFARSSGQDLWLRTGAYWLDTSERWQVANTPGSDALFVPLEKRRSNAR